MASDDMADVGPDDRYTLAPVRPEGWRGRLIPAQETSIWDWPTSLNLETARGRALLVHATNPQDIEFEDTNEIRIRAVDFVVYPDLIESYQSGELVPGCRVVLIDTDGKTFKTTSEFVAHKLAQVLQLYTRQEWRDGIPFIVRRKPSKKNRGGTYHQLEVDCG